MDKCVVVVLNSDKASFFTLEPPEWPEYESGPELIERESVLYWEPGDSHRLLSTFGGLKRSKPEASLGHSPKLDQRFAQNIISQIVSLVRIIQSQNLIIVAPQESLALIQEFFKPTLFDNLQITNINDNLGDYDSEQIHQYLAQRELVPACEKVVYPL